MPGVIWHRPQWDLRVSSFATGSRAESRLVVRYELTNRTGQPQKLTLVLAVRPFQVNPPVQFLNGAGGVSPIHDIAWNGSALVLNGTHEIFPLRPPDRAGVFSFKDGPIPRILAEPHWTGARALHDPSGYASAALAYELVLPPRGVATVGLVVPLSGSSTPPALGATPRGPMDRAPAGRRGRRVARKAQPRLAARSGSGAAAGRHDAHGAGASADLARRACASSRDAVIRTLLDP